MFGVLLLEVFQRLAPLCDGTSGRPNRVPAHDRRATPVVPICTHVEVIVIVPVLVAGNLARNTETFVEEEVKVAVVIVGVTTKVRLEADTTLEVEYANDT